MSSRTILKPDEAIPLLLDKRISPVISIDTEFDTSNAPTCRAPLRGVSIGGGTPETGFFSAFWPYGPGGEVTPWAALRDRVLIPILGDPERGYVMHPLKVDMQILRARGIGPEHVKARAFCTMSMVHAYDENLPKGLKDLGDVLLGIDGLASHSAMQKELKKIAKDGEKLAKGHILQCWHLYRDHRKKSKDIEVAINPAWNLWEKATMELPPGLTKAVVEERVGSKIFEAIRRDYESRIKGRFETYAALDALITIELYYFFLRELPPELWPLVYFEQPLCHPITTEMEENGLKIDIPKLRQIHDAMEKAIGELEKDVVARWGMDLGALPEQPETEDELEPWQTDPDAWKEGTEWQAPEAGDLPQVAELFNPASTDQVARRLWVDWQLRPPPFAIRRGTLLDKWKRKKDGLPSTHKDILEWLSNNAPEPYRTHVKKLTQLRRYQKLKSGFVVPMLQLAMSDPEGRLHPSTWPVGARTGRYAQSEPNCENIPRPSTMPTIELPAEIKEHVLAAVAALAADPKGKIHLPDPPPGVIWSKEKNKKTGEESHVWRVDSLRKVFIAPDEWELVSADLSQIENRLTAHESQDPGLLFLYRGWDCAGCGRSGETELPLEACPACGASRHGSKRDKTKAEQPAIKGFCLGRDIHASTSVRVGYINKYGFEVGREHAKTLNHAATYGMSPPTMARRDDVPVKQAEHDLEAWHQSYPFVRGGLHPRVRREIQELGHVRFFDGLHIRRFYVSQILLRSNNFKEWEWEGTIREGVNVLAQGGTGVIVKIAMKRIRERLLSHPNPLVRMTRLVNQVHDEILYEARKEVAKEVLEIICYELEHAVQLRVPVLAEGGRARDWHHAHA